MLWISVAVAVESVLASALDPSTIDSYPGARRTRSASRARSATRSRRFDDASGAVLAPLVFAASLAALVVRFRRSRGIERQQMKWLAFAGAVPVDRVRALVRL